MDAIARPPATSNPLAQATEVGARLRTEFGIGLAIQRSKP
jgi:hypothetical protein